MGGMWTKSILCVLTTCLPLWAVNTFRVGAAPSHHGAQQTHTYTPWSCAVGGEACDGLLGLMY